MVTLLPFPFIGLSLEGCIYLQSQVQYVHINDPFPLLDTVYIMMMTDEEINDAMLQNLLDQMPVERCVPCDDLDDEGVDNYLLILIFHIPISLICTLPSSIAITDSNLI